MLLSLGLRRVPTPTTQHFVTPRPHRTAWCNAARTMAWIWRIVAGARSLRRSEEYSPSRWLAVSFESRTRPIVGHQLPVDVAAVVVERGRGPADVLQVGHPSLQELVRPSGRPSRSARWPPPPRARGARPSLPAWSRLGPCGSPGHSGRCTDRHQPTPSAPTSPATVHASSPSPPTFRGKFAATLLEDRSTVEGHECSDLDFRGAPPGIRTQNLRIKSPLLCR